MVCPNLNGLNDFMKPYYQDENVVIYNADCRDVLPTLDKIDLVLTDPPYGIDGARGGGNKARGKGLYEPTGWEDTPDYIKEIVIPVIEICIKRFKRVVITPGQTHLRDYPQWKTIGAFMSPAATSFSSWGRNIWTPILYYGKDPRAGISQVPNGHTMHDVSDVKGHPCPKPLKSWRWLLNKSILEHETVLDPFMGSGTTLRAAKDLGRKAIGIEIEERYCEIAAERMSQTVMKFG